jgi:CHAT domain-containing protein/Tfp pilus assembly protein PilF
VAGVVQRAPIATVTVRHRGYNHAIITRTLNGGVVVATVVVMLVCAVAGDAWRQTAAEPVIVGQVIERALRPRETQSFPIRLEPGTFVRIEVAGHGALLRVRAASPSSGALFAADRRAGDRDPIIWAHVATAAGVYMLTVESLETSTERRYALTVVDHAPAGSGDLRRAEAIRAIESLHDPSQVGTARESSAPDSSRRALERAIQLASDIGDVRIEARARAGLARLEFEAGRSREATALLTQAGALGRRAADDRLQADILLRLGRLQGSTGQPKEAANSLADALGRFERLGDLAGQAEALMELGGVAGGRSDNDTAIDFLTRSVPLARASGDRRTEAAALNMAGVVSSNIGQPDRAVSHYEAALALRRAVDDQPGVGQTLSNLAVVLRDRGEPRAAIARYEEALPIRRASGATQGAANTLFNLGVAWADLGEHDRALALFRESLDLYRASRGRRGEAFNLLNIGQSYARLGDLEQALSYLSQSLPVWREQNDRRGEALALSGIAKTHAGRKDDARALESYGQALTLARDAGFRRETAEVLTSIAGIHVARGVPQLARETAQEAMAIAREIGNPREEARALGVIGSALLALGDHAAAVAALDAAVAAARGIEDRALEASTLSARADAAARGGDVAAARIDRLAALDLIESLRGDVGVEGLRVSFFAAKRPLYHDAVELLMASHQQDATRRHDRDAFAVGERARARALLDLLAQSRVAVEGGDASALLAELRRAQELISAKAARLTRLLNAAKPDAQAESARRELDRLLASYDELHARMRQQRPDLTPLVGPAPVTVAEIQEALDAKSVLIEYWLGERESYVWAITATGSRSAVLPGRADIEAIARRASNALNEPARQVVAEGATATAARVDASRRAFNQAAAALTNLLLTPIRDEIAGRRLLVVLDGALQYVPFAALPEPEPGGGPLIDQHEVVTLPSASVLVALADRAARRGPAASRILVFGDPVFSPNDPRVSMDRRVDTALGAAVPGNTAAAAEGFGTATLARLRFSREEATRIASLAPRRTTLALDFKATRQVALAPTIASYGIIHVAAHALLNDTQPQLSGIALSLVDERGRQQNGFVRLHDVYNMPLHASLVVLSACDTALGKDTPGEGLIGLTRGFLHAGADRVLASLWAVDDRATAALMGRFYERLLSRGTSPAAALRTAQQWMRRDPLRRHPYYWAGWVIVGDA